MIVPCIDLMDRKVVQLVQGREKALEGGTPDEMIRQFAPFPVIQVIDLDAATGQGSNEDLVEYIARRALTRVGGGVRSPEKARRLVDLGVDKVIVGTAALDAGRLNYPFLEKLVAAVPREKIIFALDSKEGHVVVKGWREATEVTAESVIGGLEPYCSGYLCTYVDKEGMLQGTDLQWFERLRRATQHEITAAGGITTMADIEALAKMNIHSAVGMAIYTGKLDLRELAAIAG